MSQKNKSLKEWVEELISLEMEGASLDEWYARAQAMVEALQSDPNGAAIPEEIWHFLSDADNRAEDPKYGVEELHKIMTLMGIDAK